MPAPSLPFHIPTASALMNQERFYGRKKSWAVMKRFALAMALAETERKFHLYTIHFNYVYHREKTKNFQRLAEGKRRCLYITKLHTQFNLYAYWILKFAS